MTLKPVQAILKRLALEGVNPGEFNSGTGISERNFEIASITFIFSPAAF